VSTINRNSVADQPELVTRISRTRSVEHQPDQHTVLAGGTEELSRSFGGAVRMPPLLGGSGSQSWRSWQ
jgi:hypothetical protein